MWLALPIPCFWSPNKQLKMIYLLYLWVRSYHNGESTVEDSETAIHLQQTSPKKQAKKMLHLRYN